MARWPTGPRTVFASDVASRATIAAARRDGRIIRLATGVWTADVHTPPEEIVRHNIWWIVAQACPDAIVVDRTAASNGTVDRGVVTISTDARTTALTLPGVTVLVRPRVGHPSDQPWSHGLRSCTPARIVVDNLAESRGRGGRPGRTLTLDELRDWLTEKQLTWEPHRLTQLRADAMALAAQLGGSSGVVAALFDSVAPAKRGTLTPGTLAHAAATDTAWDAQRLQMFARARRELSESDLPSFPAPASAHELPFHEAYFSNFIEGTEFTLDEARAIVDTQIPPARRSADGHDILGTHRLVVDPIGRAATSEDPDELIELLRRRHHTLMTGRPDIGPGSFKTEPNRAGSVQFVEPSRVRGTLLKALSAAHEVPAGPARGAYLMLVVAEVHPFTDGNGRAARLMLNAELSSSGLCRIVVPTILRNEYVQALRRFSANDGDATAIMRVLVHAWRWTASMPWHDTAATRALLAATHATTDSTEAAINGLHLRVP